MSKWNNISLFLYVLQKNKKEKVKKKSIVFDHLIGF